MANETAASQRAYQAACPGCGAPVSFLSAQSTHAVCGYCQSTVVRQGEVLSRIGKMAELFEDYSPLQLLVTGTYLQRRFTLVGRLQYRSPTGTWTEWNALFDDGSPGWLAEDNGAYVFTQPLDAQRDLPSAARFRVGAQTAINGTSFTVASNVQAVLISAQGELPAMPPLGQPFDMVELRNEAGEVLSIDYTRRPPAVSRGRAVLLEGLALQGLKDASAKEEQGRQFSCPHCGAPVTVALATSKSVTCASCHSLIDLGSGVGGELRSALQDEPVEPLIALGSVGTLQGQPWQVVGYQHRWGQVPGDDEQFGWSEYLLYNRKLGFCFLVDAEEGWSLVRPATGAPRMASSSATTATYLGASYQLKYSYNAETDYVRGEFYWQVRRGQKSFNRDFARGRQLLSLEQDRDEMVWSVGEQMGSDAVAKAFALDGRKESLRRGDVTPFSAAPSVGIGTIIIVLVLTLILVSALSRCSRCDPEVENCTTSSGSRSSGGSFGGYAGGGGHK